MSDLLGTCPHCNRNLSDADPGLLKELRRRKLRDRIYHLKMISYLALGFFLGGWIWYWAESDGFQQAPTTPPLVLLAIGIIGYLAVRALMIVARFQIRNRR